MLVLARKIGQSILIGNNVDITVLGVKGNQVRIGIAAPREILVDRKEKRLPELPQTHQPEIETVNI